MGNNMEKEVIFKDSYLLLFSDPKKLSYIVYAYSNLIHVHMSILECFPLQMKIY